MPASPTESTSGAARDRAATETATTETATTEASLRAAAIVVDSPAAVKGAVSPASPTGSSGKAGAGALKCPRCGEPLDRYLGDNPHKVGTGFCQAEGVRVPLAAQSSASSASAASAS